MISFVVDEFKNIIHYIINYYNNQYLMNLWFRYIDYYNINSVYNNSILLYHIIIISLVSLYLLSKIYYISVHIF